MDEPKAIKPQKIGFFDEGAPGNKSMMRLCQFIDNIAVMIIALYAVYMGRDIFAVATLATAILGTINGAKAWQKMSETKNAMGVTREITTADKDGGIHP